MSAISSVILLLVFSITMVTADPTFFGRRRGRQRHIPTLKLPPLPSLFRLGSQRDDASHFTVHAQYIDSPALKLFQNSIDTIENDLEESDVTKFEDTLDTTEDILFSDVEDFVTEADDEDFVTELDVEDSTATEEPIELRELLSEDENNENSLLHENTIQKSVTKTLLDFDNENIILDSIFPQHFPRQSLVTESFFKVIHENTVNDIKFPNFINPPEVVEHFSFEDNPKKESTDNKPLTEAVTKHIIKESTTTESFLVTLTETESVTVTETEYSSVSYTPVFITVTDVIVESDCIKLNLPNTVTVYDTETLTTIFTEYIQDSGVTVRTVTDTRYSTTTVTSSLVSIIQTITDLLQVQTCTCLI